MLNKTLRNRILLLPLLLAVFAVYWNVLDGEFQFDDRSYIAEGQLINEPSKLLEMDLADILSAGRRPLIELTFALNYAVGGTDVRGYHLLNVAVHIIVVLLVYLFIRRTLLLPHVRGVFSGRAEWIAIAAAGIFAVHPMQTESVAYIVQRAETVASLFYLLSLLFLIKFSEARGKASAGFWFLGVASFVLGWASKEIIISVPAAFVIYGVFFMERGHIRRAVIGLAPFLVAGVVLSIWAISGFEGDRAVGFGIAGLGQPEYFYTEMRVLATYLRLIFLPFNQNVDYDYPVYRDLLDVNVIISAFFWFMALGMSLYALGMSGRWKWHFRAAGFGMLWFFAILFPTSSVVPIRDVIFEHRVYLSMMGVILAFVVAADAGLSVLAERYSQSNRKIMLILLVVVLAATLVPLTYKRNTLWQNKLTMWKDVAAKSPNDSKSWNNLGLAYNEKGLYDEAIEHLEVAIKLEPDLSLAYSNLGDSYLQKNLLDEAIENYKRALILGPRQYQTHNNICLAYILKDLNKEAMKHCRKAIQIWPRYAHAHFHLGTVYLAEGFIDKAIEHLEIALSIKPDYDVARRNLDIAYKYKRLSDKSLK
jgi:Tfp pilus assembly protein PilF